MISVMSVLDIILEIVLDIIPLPCFYKGSMLSSNWHPWTIRILGEIPLLFHFRSYSV